METSLARHSTAAHTASKYSYNMSSLPQYPRELEGHSYSTCATIYYLPGIQWIANSHAAAKAQALGSLPAPSEKMLRRVCWGAILDESESSRLDLGSSAKNL